MGFSVCRRRSTTTTRRQKPTKMDVNVGTARTTRGWLPLGWTLSRDTLLRSGERQSSSESTRTQRTERPPGQPNEAP